MSNIYSAYDIFQIVVTCEFTPSVVVERTGRDFQYDKCVDTYSFEITPDMIFQYNGCLHQVTDEMVGIWETGWERHKIQPRSFTNFSNPEKFNQREVYDE